MEKDIMKILVNYIRYWYLFLIGAGLCIILAFLYIRYKVVPEYQISGKILLNDKMPSNAAMGAPFGDLGLLKVSSSIADEIGVLQSYDLMKKTVEEMDLSVGYYAQGRIGTIEIYEKNLPFKVILNDILPILNYGVMGSVLMTDKNHYKFTNANGDTKTTTYTFGEEVKTAFGTFKIVLNPEKDHLETEPIFIELRDIGGVAGYYTG